MSVTNTSERTVSVFAETVRRLCTVTSISVLTTIVTTYLSVCNDSIFCMYQIRCSFIKVPRKIKIGENFYYPKNIECSSKGRIRNSNTHGIILPTPAQSSSNFYRFFISVSKLGVVGGGQTRMLVSRLLAMTENHFLSS